MNLGLINDDLMQLITSTAFQKIFCLDNLTIAQFNSLCTILIKSNIPFDTQFTTGTRRDEPSLQVTIYINPNTTINYTFNGSSQNSINTNTVNTTLTNTNT